ncbi:MAG: hypothetical protein ACKN87_16495 [Microcystis aeruginosa]
MLPNQIERFSIAASPAGLKIGEMGIEWQELTKCKDMTTWTLRHF